MTRHRLRRFVLRVELDEMRKGPKPKKLDEDAQLLKDIKRAATLTNKWLQVHTDRNPHLYADEGHLIPSGAGDPGPAGRPPR